MMTSTTTTDALSARLSDLTHEADRLAAAVKARGDALPALLLARLLVDADKLCACLRRHGDALEAATPRA